jgi:hypothetical protein
MRSPGCLSVRPSVYPLKFFRFLCGPCRIKGKYVIASFQISLFLIRESENVYIRLNLEIEFFTIIILSHLYHIY